ncbi:MAG: hypothetical protein AB7E37_04440 [Candidatus Altimarinota bacterium]
MIENDKRYLEPKTIGEVSSTITDEVNAQVDGILKGVELKDRNESKPGLSVSDFGIQELSKLEENIQGGGVVAVVRCWNKSEDDIASFLERVQKIYKYIPHLKGIFVSINFDAEEQGLTQQNLQRVLSVNPMDLPIIPINIHGYSWTSGLNAPVAILNELSKNQNVDTALIRVMNLSFGVDIPEEELVKLSQNIKENKYVITARRTSDQDTPFVSQRELWEKFKGILRSPNETDLTELAYTMRNTFNVIPLQDIVKLGGFNPLCNGDSREFNTTQPSPFYKHIGVSKETKVTIRGMEDSEFFMRLILSSLHSGDISMLKEFKQAMESVVYYDDYDWNKMHELKKIGKIGNEMNALSLIISGLATRESIHNPKTGEFKTLQLLKDLSLPTLMQDFYLRKS